MSEEKKSSYRGFTPAQAAAHKKYMKDFVELKVRMTPDKRTKVQSHAQAMGESATAFVNRAIDKQMERDLEAKQQDTAEEPQAENNTE